MIDRNKRGIRSVGVKARLAIAAAVLVGGGAAGVVVASSHTGTTTAESAGYSKSYNHWFSETNFRHSLSEQTALTSAFSTWGTSWSTSLTTLAKMTQLRTFSQVKHHNTMLAAQRGIVVLATKKFLIVKSFNGSLHLWWLSGGTAVKNVGASATGMVALTGSNTAALTAMMTGNMVPASTFVAGSTAVTKMTTPVAKPTTVTINTGGLVITVTVASTTATVTQPTAMTTMTAMPTTSVLSAFNTTRGLKRGDLVFVAGTRTHGTLKAKIVLFAAPLNAMPTPTATPTISATPTATATPTAKPTSTGAPTFTGTSS